MPLTRAKVIGLMRKAFREGVSTSRFLTEMKVKGLTYRRTTMLADWRTVNQLEKKEGLLRFVRKDYYPSVPAMAESTWKLPDEYTYKVKVHSRLTPEAPITERFVQIGSDVPMTPREMEAQVKEELVDWEEKYAEKYVGFELWTAVRKVME